MEALVDRLIPPDPQTPGGKDAGCATLIDRQLAGPLLRMTFDFHQNELKMSQYLTDKLAEIGQKMGPRQLIPKPRKGPYDITDYQTTHTCGGAVMGTDPSTSALNRYPQAGTFLIYPCSALPRTRSRRGYNPTNTVGASAASIWR